ncbi:cupin [Sphaerisporangium album]|uniref:Cupin n=1 Tax=Sphaerisporangium album TaxID=509200 RepID=A0A367FK42_9ACTN|nr:cupin [Sphaerisporangium album]RCG30763.1 cupin [Sphaerisporangium album]
MRIAVRAGLVGVMVAGLSSVGGAADASPGTGVTGTIIARITVGGRDYILREITLQPGGSTGWHFHDGTLYVRVRQGMLSHYGATCALDNVHGPGAEFVEPSGVGHVHLGRNLGPRPVILDVVYVDPAGSPLSQDAPNPGCDFQ